MQYVGYLSDGKTWGSKQPSGLGCQHLVDILNNRAPSDLLDDARKIGSRDMQLVGIKANVVMIGVVLSDERVEIDEDIFCTSRDMIGSKRVFLNVNHVKDKHGI